MLHYEYCWLCPLRLVGQDTGFSSRQQEFESPRGRQKYFVFFIAVSLVKGFICFLENSFFIKV